MCDVKIGRIGPFDLNPRGELWVKDENRFGHKLLSKFGWSQGKGLGKNEDGIAESLKVRKKMGKTGVGWDEKLPVGIDYREYDALMANLNERYNKKQGGVKHEGVIHEGVSLEKRVQEFKNRMNYQKFIKGKDISRYSEKDMSCIFPTREPEEEMESTAEDSTITNIESRPTNLPTKESVPTFNSQLSIADYFAMKMKNKFGLSLNLPIEPNTCVDTSTSEIDVKSKKRKQEFKSSKKAKRMKPELGTSEGNLSDQEENTSESPTLPHECPDEVSVLKEQLQNVEEGESESVRKKKKSSKKMKKMLNALKSKQDNESNQEENNLIEDESLEKQPQEVCSNLVEEFSNMTQEEVSSKKRKKEQKRCKKAKKRNLEEVEMSLSIDKNSSFSESDHKEKNCSEEATTDTIKTEKQFRKESKKHKNKVSNLKSCLKSCLSNNKYSFKDKQKVSFCESISYKVIENVLDNFDSDIVLETNEQLLSCSDEDCTDSEVANETQKNVVVDHVNDSKSSNTSSNGDVQCVVEDDPSLENSDMVDDNTVPECFKLPKRNSANYNSWLETQRIAAKMKVYKNMVKKIKKHPVLRKTNLLQIKGYGNWGV